MRTALLAILVLWLGACGKSADPAPGDQGASPSAGGGDALDITGFCARTMKAANPTQCYGRDARAEQIKRAMCVELLGGAHAGGRIEIDRAAFAACEQAAIAGLATLSNQRGISDLAETFPACRGVITGKVAAGEECLGTMECAPGLVCTGMMCRPPRKEGQDCRAMIELSMAVVGDSDCADGLYCDGDHQCRPRLAAAAACTSSEACADGLRCRGEVCVTAAPSKAGEACDDQADCPAGHFCTLGGGRCEPLRADGEACMSNTECAHQCVTGDSISGVCGPC